MANRDPDPAGGRRQRTRAAILDTAERAFAEHGYAATSLRQLTRIAGVNLAAVHYHFGSKEGLAKAVLARRFEPINAERQRRLDGVLAAPAPDLAAIVRAFIEPPLRAGELPARPGGDAPLPADRLCRVFGRISVEQPQFLRAFLVRQFRAVGSRFVAALERVLPDVGRAELWWRLHFLIGAMAHTLQNSATLVHVSGGACAAGDPESLIEHLVAFATHGLRAGAVTRPRPPTRRRARGRP
jgi:AcrR family transcriptional regulator